MKPHKILPPSYETMTEQEILSRLNTLWPEPEYAAGNVLIARTAYRRSQSLLPLSEQSCNQDED